MLPAAAPGIHPPELGVLIFLDKDITMSLYSKTFDVKHGEIP